MNHHVLTLESPNESTAVLTLNRPERRNALSIELMESLCGALESLAAEPQRRVAILCGAGPVFCAGLDLYEAAEAEASEQSAHWMPAKVWRHFENVANRNGQRNKGQTHEHGEKRFSSRRASRTAALADTAYLNCPGDLIPSIRQFAGAAGDGTRGRLDRRKASRPGDGDCDRARESVRGLPGEGSSRPGGDRPRG
ncbi:MAG: enoyl-CoA hydratase/isomerase family protein [Pirellulales bacterium]|nr:enoyl-CoA hydratase/isomerase family protein [Pirellulales bacterium]